MGAMALRSQLVEVAKSYPNASGNKFSYGTAGFRNDATVLSSVSFRVGIIAALRSLSTGKVTGVVITASHNQVSDNGVKLVDPAGDMLVMTWESYAERIVNAEDPADILDVVDEVISNEHLHAGWKGRVFIARDTRPSGPALLSAAMKGVEAMNASAVDMGVLTTPQLHWMVRSTNLGNASVNEVAYYATLAEAFRNLLELNPRRSVYAPISEVVVDGANGVGASKLLELQMLVDNLNVEVRNSGEGELNCRVGADFVQKERVLPAGFTASADVERRCVSIDGDADRLVYFYICNDGALHLLDGDKILSLFAVLLKQQLEGLVQPGKSNFLPGYGDLKFGVVQTAYANGASTRYLREALGLDVVRTPTGVKYLHEEAKKLDVGIYFEANGHGTILFKEDFLVFLRRQLNCNVVPEESRRQVMQRLLAISDMVNQAIGDAISGLLMVEVALAYLGWTAQQWDAIYTDVPSRQLKVKVKDRSLIATTDAETRVSKPLELQVAIDREVDKYEQGRSFARASGTEDVVRVYAEAASQTLADKLAAAVAAAVSEHAGGAD